MLGQCALQLSSSADDSKQSIKTFAIVVDSVSHPVLISWHDLQALKVIPKVFPASACSATSDSNLKTRLFEEYPEVFRDTLLPEPMMGEPVKIKLKDTILKKQRGARINLLCNQKYIMINTSASCLLSLWVL